MIHKVLLVEDDKAMSEYLKMFLTENDYSVWVEGTGASALKHIEKQVPDLILLDLSLPDISGEDVCMQVRKKHPELPIIILTAKDSLDDKVHGLKLGADDYMTKPFAGEELLARIHAILRRVQDDSPNLVVGDLVMDTKRIQVSRGGIEVTLTPQEFKLLEYLMHNKGIVLTREAILNRIWLYSPDVESRVVDVYMGYLRKKIDSKHKKKLLHSVRGFGYTIKD